MKMLPQPNVTRESSLINEDPSYIYCSSMFMKSLIHRDNITCQHLYCNSMLGKRWFRGVVKVIEGKD